MSGLAGRVVACAMALCASQVQAQGTTTSWPTGIGFPNVAHAEGELIYGPFAQDDGRMALLAWHNGVLFSLPELPSSEPGSNFQARMWNLSDPSNPLLIVTAPANAQGSLGQSPQPINAHGYLHVGQNMQTSAAGHYLVVGADWPPEAPWGFRAQTSVPGVVREASGNLGAGVRGDLFQPWFVGQTWWSYGAIEGLAEIRFGGNVFNPGSQQLASFDHLGATGVVGHPFLLGNLLIYASDQSRTGVATYDISNPAQPVLLDVLTTGGAGGYWPELWGSEGELYVVFPYNDNGGNGIRVVDATDPTALRFVGDTPLPRPNGSSGAMYAQFQDEYAFIGDHKIDMRTRQSVRQFATIANDIDMSQFALPVGNLLITGGIGTSQGIAIYAHQAAPDTRAPSVAFHVPRAGQTGYPLGAPISLLIHETLDTLSIVNGSSLMLRRVLGPGSYGVPLVGRWVFSFDDVLTFTADAPLDADATYEMRLDAIRDVAGNAMPPYAFTFSTGGAVNGNHPPQVDAFVATPYPAAPGASVAFDANASDADGDALQYRFDFGDGSPRTAWSAAGTTSHGYAAAGHYRSVVQARDSAGVIGSRSHTVTVLDVLPATRPTASAPILCDATNRRVWTVNPDSDSVSALGADTLSKVAEFATCDDPRSVARTSAGELWIACHDDDRVRILNEANGAQIAQIDTDYGSGPIAVALSPNGAQAFVALAGRGEVRRYDTGTRQQTGALALGRDPRALAVSADGTRLLVTRFVSPAHHGEVWDVDAASLQLTRTIRLPKIGGDDNRDTPASGRGVPNYLASIALSPRSGEAFVAGNKPNSERGILIHPSQDLDEDNTVRNLLVQLDPGAVAPFRRAIDLDNSDSASAVAFSPLGDYLLVALQGMDEVVVLDALALDANTGLGAQVTRLGSGAAPQGVCSDATTGRSFVHNFMGRSVTVLETATLFGSGSIQVSQNEVAMVTNEALSTPVLSGKRLFYGAGDTRMSAEGYISCATCHVDGGEDGRAWDFGGRGEGLRNTVTLNGRGGTAHGNVHWSANFDEIHDFEADIRNFFGGSGFMSNADFAANAASLGPPKAGHSADLDALAAYVTSLGHETLRRSPYRSSTGQLTATGAQGEAIFLREGCTSCHAPPRFTDSTVGAATLHDVGTLRDSSGLRLGGVLAGIDTPTLRGVWASAPYFHDGSAAMLTDVFRVTGGNTLPAEAAQFSGGAGLVNTYVDLNNDDTLRDRAYVQLEDAAHRLTFAAVDGGPGGVGAIEVRYSNSRTGGQTQALSLRVNGGTQIDVALPAVENSPTWRSTNWSTYRIDGVTLAPGATNTLEFSTNNWYAAIDEILVAHSGHLAQAQPHRRVLALPQNEQDALLDYLRQLDGSPSLLLPEEVFANGFEE